MKCELMMLLTGVAFVAGADVVGSVDFSREIGKVRPALHSSGWTPRSSPRGITKDDEIIKSMGFAYARTHDWALVNEGQRVIDYQYVFPLFDKDARDPSNYIFEPTDHLLELSRNAGLKTFYRLGTSIEHTDNEVFHYNSRVPKDFNQLSEIFAGIVRHYNRGWANGKKWDIQYWEIWNEPNLLGSMWWEPGEEGKDVVKMRAKFVELFVTVLKRLKSEFPEVKVGGPALCWFDCDYIHALFKACRESGLAPDFFSWHYYGPNPQGGMIARAHIARKLCDEYGFKNCELILNEWHYLDSPWTDLRSTHPALYSRAHDGATGHNNIDSAAFTLTALSLFQTSPLDQAYYYGCSPEGDWGYRNEHKQLNKNYFACKLFGDLVRDYGPICESKSEKSTVTTFAVRSKDGKKQGLLVVDYRGTDQVLELDVKGVAKSSRASAIVLDHTRDDFPCEVGWRDGRLTLVKPDKNSSAWFVTFE